MRRLPALRSCQAITQRTPHWIQGCHRTKPRTYTVGLKRHDIADYLPPAQSPTTLPRSTNRFVTRIAGAIRPVEVEMEQPKKRTVSETRVRGPEQPVLTRIYSWEDWEQHRRTSRYLRHFVAIKDSRIVRGLIWPVAWVSFVAFVLGVYETIGDLHMLPYPLPQVTVIYRPFEITSFALALLLVFRTDASYGRFMSARDNWRAVIAETRELLRLGGVFLKQDTVKEEQLRRWTVAFAWCMRDHLLPATRSDLQDRLVSVLTEREMQAVMGPTISSKPNLVLVIITELIHQMKTESGVMPAMLECLARLESVVADCERILKTPIPLSYTRHTSRFLISYLTFLPLALWEETSWGVVPISGIVAFFLLGIDEIGVQIEEPFSIMPLDRYCQTIQDDAASASINCAVAIEVLRPLLQEDNGILSD